MMAGIPIYHRINDFNNKIYIKCSPLNIHELNSKLLNNVNKHSFFFKISQHFTQELFEQESQKKSKNHSTKKTMHTFLDILDLTSKLPKNVYITIYRFFFLTYGSISSDNNDLRLIRRHWRRERRYRFIIFVLLNFFTFFIGIR